jgi:phosphate:Na+ symporter
MNWWTLSILLLGGLAIFLHGMTVMTDALKAAAGNRMKSFLKSMTRNRWTSLLAGTGITAVIQSSSVTTVLAVGFVSAGLLSFQSTLGLILGANLGTTITAQIIAFKITSASWLMVIFGYLVSLVFSQKALKEIGLIILGLGLVFLGMNVMGEATEPLKTYAPFIELMKGLDNYLWGILIGTVFTAAVQSSSATTGVVIVMASQGLIGLEPAIAIIMGANVGTCVTAILSAIGKPRAAMRVALSHILFKVAGVLLWYAFIGELAQLVSSISGDSETRQIANAHTLFNVGNSLVFIWLVHPVSKLVLWLVPVKKKDSQQLFPELHTYYLENPAMAIELVKNSIAKLGRKSLDILEDGLEVALNGKQTELRKLRSHDEIIDRGQQEILLFVQQIQGHSLTKNEAKKLEQLVEAVNVLESAADLITTNLVEAAEHRIEMGFTSSQETTTRLKALYALALRDFNSALQKYMDEDGELSREISKQDFKLQFNEVRSYLTTRLAVNDDMRISIYRFESELLEAVRRLHSLARRLDRKV